MEEIKNQAKCDKSVIAKGAAEIALYENENVATKVAILNKTIMDNTILTNMIKIAGDVMLDMQDEINGKEVIIKEYEIVIGDNVVNQTILSRAKENYDLQYDVDRTDTKNKIIERMSRKSNRCIKQS